MLLNYISWPIFFLSFAIGTLIVYLWGPDIKTIKVYPTPDNVGQIHYKDKADNCFVYTATELNCPEDTTKIKEIPIQGSHSDM